MAIRVYELAREIGWATPELREWLKQAGEFVRSAASTVDDGVARRVRALDATDRPVMPSRQTSPIPIPPPPAGPRYWAITGYGDTETWVGPDPMTAQEATFLLRGVKESTIRQWVRRGLLPVAGQRGRANMFHRTDLQAVHRRTQLHICTKRSVRVQRELTREGVDAVVTITEAATWTGVSRSTLSSWVRRGRLHPVETRGRTRLYRLPDVYRVARQSNPPTTWATSTD